MGCGRKAGKAELLRFVVDERGRILFDGGQEAPGRGGYLCLKEPCFVQAVKKRRFSARFRREVKVEDVGALIRMVQEQLGGGSSGWPR